MRLPFLNPQPVPSVPLTSAPPSKVRLRIVADIALCDGCYLAQSETPWFRIDFGGPLPAGRWVELTYAASLLEPLSRPVLRAIAGEGHHDAILPGALFGRGIWLGLIPAGTREVWISPTNRPGSFRFAIESIGVLSRAAIAWRCFRRDPGWCLAAIGAHIIGLRYTAAIVFRRALLPTPFKDYDAWRKRRLRDADLTGFDAPLTDWTGGVHIRFVMDLACGDAGSWQVLAALLRAQPYPNWSVAIIVPAAVEGNPGPGDPPRDPRLLVLQRGTTAAAMAEDLPDTGIITPIAIGDEVPAYSLAVLGEAANREPEVEIFYGDEDFRDMDGRWVAPLLKPDWSPVFESASPYLGAAIYFRAKSLKQHGHAMSAVDFVRMPGEAARNFAVSARSICHIRRVMRVRSSAALAAFHPPCIALPGSSCQSPASAARTQATLIIPTKDRLGLLARCVASLRRTALFDDIEIIIVDNGSVHARTRSFLACLARENHFRVLSCPGPFNFSMLCNRAAAQAQADVLVFLNDDTEAVDAHWLAALLTFARRPDVGAVGAKLLFPNRLLQHAGVALGIDGRAGHFQRMLDKDDPGYFGRLCVPHEVSAVTGACLAVEKHKFNAVQGFDVVHLPVELNDIDLCLRLAGRGWKTICASNSVLIHHESASRGPSRNPDELYQRERRYFRDKWLTQLRDDPYFHPALSLDTLRAALG